MSWKLVFNVFQSYECYSFFILVTSKSNFGIYLKIIEKTNYIKEII